MCTKKKSCGCSINGIGMAKKRKRYSRTAKIDLVEAGKKVLVGTLGFGMSNVITDQINTYMTNPLDENMTGVAKIALGVGTIYLTLKSSKATKDIAIPAAAGMAMSGTLDLAKKNLPDNIKTAIGIGYIQMPLGLKSRDPNYLRNRYPGKKARSIVDMRAGRSAL